MPATVRGWKQGNEKSSGLAAYGSTTRKQWHRVPRRRGPIGLPVLERRPWHRTSRLDSPDQASASSVADWRGSIRAGLHDKGARLLLASTVVSRDEVSAVGQNVEKILEVGAEGGALIIGRIPGGPGSQSRFVLVRDESALARFFDDDAAQGGLHERQETGDWDAVVTAISRYPWHKLTPLFIHPEFRERILHVVLKRGGIEAVARWEHRCPADDVYQDVRAGRREPEVSVSLPFESALVLASLVHHSQRRKKTDIPYITHPVHVARILDRHQWPEHVVLAGLLHDVLEDARCEDAAFRERVRTAFEALRQAPEGEDAFRRELARSIEACFGESVMRLVEHVSERKTEGGMKRPWKTRKLEALESLKHAEREHAALKAADLLHNMTCITSDVAAKGPSVMERFNAPADQTVWYYGEASALVRERLGADDPLAVETNEAFRRLQDVVTRACRPSERGDA